MTKSERDQWHEILSYVVQDPDSPDETEGQGIGIEFLESVCSQLDKLGVLTSLTPDSSLKRLAGRSLLSIRENHLRTVNRQKLNVEQLVELFLREISKIALVEGFYFGPAESNDYTAVKPPYRDGEEPVQGMSRMDQEAWAEIEAKRAEIEAMRAEIEAMRAEMLNELRFEQPRIIQRAQPSESEEAPSEDTERTRLIISPGVKDDGNKTCLIQPPANPDPKPEPADVNDDEPLPDLSPSGLSTKRLCFGGFCKGDLFPNTSFILDVWAFLPEQRTEVIQLTELGGRKQSVGLTSTLVKVLDIGTQLNFTISSDVLEIDEGSETEMIWGGEPQNVSFKLSCPGNAETQATAKVTIWTSGVPIATLLLDLDVSAKRIETPELPRKLTQAHAINSAFASYSRKDVDAVMGRVSAMKRANREMEIFVDVFDLKEKGWVEELMEKAVNFDAFFLFWSENAMASKWVEREWRTALEKKGVQFIEPMPLQAPHEAPPPQELRDLNFTDRYVIMAKGMRRDG